MLDRPGIAPLAQRQLAAWEALAGRWPLELDSTSHPWVWLPLELDSTSHPWVWRCARCPAGKGVFLATDTAGARYRWTAQQRIQMITLHLRNHHLDLDPERCVP